MSIYRKSLYTISNDTDVILNPCMIRFVMTAFNISNSHIPMRHYNSPTIFNFVDIRDVTSRVNNLIIRNTNVEFLSVK